MFSRAEVSRHALNYFRKLARHAAPLEIQAYLAGKVISINEVRITDFLYTKQYYTQSTNFVSWFTKDFDILKEKIESEGKTIIGEIHSHPNWDAVMSSVDYDASVTQQFALCGICSVNNNKTRVRFWTPTSSLPCKIVYL